MSIFLLSDTANLSPPLRARLVRELESRGRRVAYVSSAPQDEDRVFFEAACRHYASIWSKADLEYFDLSSAFSAEQLQGLANFDAIHLSGGNTYAFLHAIRRRGVARVFSDHSGNGLLIGVSAGAIVLTPDIGSTELCGDRNLINLRDTSGLALVDFLFLPHLGSHFVGGEADMNAACAYAASVGRSMYVACDEDGIFVDDEGHVIPYGQLRHIV